MNPPQRISLIALGLLVLGGGWLAVGPFALGLHEGAGDWSTATATAVATGATVTGVAAATLLVVLWLTLRDAVNAARIEDSA